MTNRVSSTFGKSILEPECRGMTAMASSRPPQSAMIFFLATMFWRNSCEEAFLDLMQQIKTGLTVSFFTGAKEMSLLINGT
jgi:hypothetical protein